MAQRSKAYKAAAEKIEEGRLYSAPEAIALAQEINSSKADPTVEVAMRLSVDPRKADQMVRGTVNLPNGTGKTARVLVFANAEKAEAAREAGADHVGSDELIEKVAGGWLDFDAVVATPDLMGKVGKLGRVLGPRRMNLDVGEAEPPGEGGLPPAAADIARTHFERLQIGTAKRVVRFYQVRRASGDVKP